MQMKYAKKQPVTGNIVFVDGLARTGKALIASIVSHFENHEHWQYQIDVEHTCYLNLVGALTDEYAEAFIQYMAEWHIYARFAGRNLNTNIHDLSSITRSADPDIYTARAEILPSAEAIEQHNNQGRIAVFQVHNTLSNAPFLFRAFPEMKFVYMERHPLDLAYSRYKRGWGERESKDPSSFTPLIEEDGVTVPWFAAGWAADYDAMSLIERSISSVLHLWAADNTGYDALSKQRKARVLRLRYERLMSDPGSVVGALEEFLGQPPRAEMAAFLKKECSSRSPDANGREKKCDELAKASSPELMSRLLAVAGTYENE